MHAITCNAGQNRPIHAKGLWMPPLTLYSFDIAKIQPSGIEAAQARFRGRRFLVLYVAVR